MVYVIYVMMNTNKYFILLFLILNNFVFGIKEIKLNTPEKLKCSPPKAERVLEKIARGEQMIIKSSPILNKYEIIMQNQNGSKKIGEIFDYSNTRDKNVKIIMFDELGKRTLTIPRTMVGRYPPDIKFQKNKK